MFANLLYGETLAPGQTLIHAGTKPWLCVLEFLGENVLPAVGECVDAGSTSPSVAQHPGKTVCWHLMLTLDKAAVLWGVWVWGGQKELRSGWRWVCRWGWVCPP